MDEILSINLPFKTGMEVSLTDLQGKILLQKKTCSDKNALDVKDLGNGFYYMYCMPCIGQCYYFIGNKSFAEGWKTIYNKTNFHS